MRGQKAGVGDTMVNKNGYHNTRTETGWRLTHHLVAEKKLGRPLRDDEMVRFVDKDRSNLKSSNIEIINKRRGSDGKRKAQLEDRIRELFAQLQDLDEEEALGFLKSLSSLT